MSGKLNDYLADINDEAEEMFSQLMTQMMKKQGATEVLKANNQLLWVQMMNNIRDSAIETVNHDFIFTYICTKEKNESI